MEKLKKRWGINSNWQIILIIIVFGLTGSSSVYIAEPILAFFGFFRESFDPEFFWGGFSYYSLRILLIFPVYQVLLIFFGWLFGQFRFFWSFEKKMLSRIGFAKFLS